MNDPRVDVAYITSPSPSVLHKSGKPRVNDLFSTTIACSDLFWEVP